MQDEKKIRELIKNGVTINDENRLYDELDVIRKRKLKIRKRL